MKKYINSKLLILVYSLVVIFFGISLSLSFINIKNVEGNSAVQRCMNECVASCVNGACNSVEVWQNGWRDACVNGCPGKCSEMCTDGDYTNNCRNGDCAQNENGAILTDNEIREGRTYEQRSERNNTVSNTNRSNFTNICGSDSGSFDGRSEQCRGCTPSGCGGPYVYKFVCQGRHSECGGNGAIPFRQEGPSTYISAGEAQCGVTVQIDVFTGPNFQGLIDFIVFYTGDCPPESTPSPQPPAEERRSITARCNETCDNNCESGLACLNINGTNRCRLPSNPTSETCQPLVENPDFRIEKTLIDPREVYYVGEIVSFNVRVYNTGRTTFTSISFRDQFDPLLLRYTNGSVSKFNSSTGQLLGRIDDLNSIITYNNGLITISNLAGTSLGVLAPDQYFEFNLRFIVNAPSNNQQTCNTAFARPLSMEERNSRACLNSRNRDTSV